MSESVTVFEEYPQVSCNDCENYWLNLCDGSTKEIKCKHYKASRKVVIPMQIEELQRQVHTNRILICICSGLLFTLSLLHLMKVM